MLIRIALRNIWLHRLRTLVVGGLIAVGTILLIVGTAVLDAVDNGMQKSIVASVAGHIQVYSSDAKDELALFGQPGMVQSDLDKVDDFGAARDALLTLDNVEKVIPMGIGNSIVFGGNVLDIKLAALRAAVGADDKEATESLKAHVRKMVEVLQQELTNISDVVETTTTDKEGLAALERASKDAFWTGFDANPMAALEMLENRVAPLGVSADLIFMRYIGTDPTAFSQAFELFEIVNGDMIPPGQRGILLNKAGYERFMKKRVAYKLDEIKKARDEDQRLIATDEELQTWVEQTVKQYGTIVLDLNSKDAKYVAGVLREHLGSDEQDLGELVQAFLKVDDGNFDARHAFFYEHIAPRIILYRYELGDEMTISSFTRAGYPKSVNVKIYGTFQFESLERSQLAGAFHLMDMLTFRELYGFATPEQQAEMNKLDATIAVKEVAAEDAEAELFGGDGDLSDETDGGGFDEFAGVDLAGRRAAAMEAQRKPYTAEEMDRGMVLNMAVFLKDPERLEETKAEITALSEAKGLGLQAIGWHAASGLIGDFTSVIYLVLMVMVAIIFIVASIIIINSMIMATLERVKEIGTMRAIGAQRSFVQAMVLVEALTLCLLFGMIGTAVGGGIVLALEATGIAAFDQILFFLFGGPALHPPLELAHIGIALIVVVAVSLVSSIAPAIIATRIEPVVAMQTKE